MEERRVLFIEGLRALRVQEFFSIQDLSEKKTPIRSLLPVLFFFCMGFGLLGLVQGPNGPGITIYTTPHLTLVWMAMVMF